MKTKYHKPLLALGIYELFYSLKLIWNLAYGHMNSIMIADQIVRGIPANMIFLAIAVSGVCLGYGIIRLKRWSYYGFITLNCLLALIYLSNLFLIGIRNPSGFFRTIPENYLTDIRLEQLRKAIVVMALSLFIWYYRKQFKDQNRQQLHQPDAE